MFLTHECFFPPPILFRINEKHVLGEDERGVAVHAFHSQFHMYFSFREENNSQNTYFTNLLNLHLGTLFNFLAYHIILNLTPVLWKLDLDTGNCLPSEKPSLVATPPGVQWAEGKGQWSCPEKKPQPQVVGVRLCSPRTK